MLHINMKYTSARTHTHDTHVLHTIACTEMRTHACINEHLHSHRRPHTHYWTKAGLVPPWGHGWKGGLGDEREVRREDVEREKREKG